MRMFKVKLIGEENPAYLQGANLADALQRTDFVLGDLDTVVEIDDKVIFNALLHKYVQLNALLENEGATPLTLADATSLGLTHNCTDKEMEEMARNRALDELQEFDDDDSDDDEGWEGDDLISLIGK